nr:ribosomal protein S18-alanine N-acetyltransferase [uncultured Cetobacterium sp.]
MSIKIINKDDETIIKNIISLEKEIFKESSYSEKSIREMVESNLYLILVDWDKELKGYIIFHDSYDLFEIMKIAVSENYRGMDIGKKLLEKYFQLDEKNIFLEVRESNIRAQKFYKKMKFQIVGKRKKYYSNGETAILMLLERN